MIEKFQSRPICLRALVLLSALAPNCAYAKFFHFPVTPLEQMSRLSSVAVQGAARKLFRPGSGTTIAWPSAGPVDRSDRYLLASLGERKRIAERIGEDGVAKYAAQEKWKTLLDPRDRKMRTGPDSVYWNRKDGKLIVAEAKGGSSEPKQTYKSRQGTNANTIRSADGLLGRSGASRTQKLQSARILIAASRGQLSTVVVKTPHVLGTPGDPRLSSSNNENVAKEARRRLQLAKQDPELRKLIRKAGFLHSVDRLNYIGQAAGRWFLPVSSLSTGVKMVTAYRKFSSGLISPREFYRSSTGPTMGIVFTVTGAIVGGVFFGAGAVAGGSLGAMAAVPVEFAIGWLIDRHYHDFDLRRRRMVDKAVEEFYDVDATLIEES